MIPVNKPYLPESDSSDIVPAVTSDSVVDTVSGVVCLRRVRWCLWGRLDVDGEGCGWNRLSAVGDLVCTKVLPIIKDYLWGQLTILMDRSYPGIY